MKVKVDLGGLVSLQDRLKKNILKKAIRSGAKLAIADMRANVIVTSGALKKSIGSKVDSPKGGLISYAVIGPRSSYTLTYKGEIRHPSRYAHFTLKRANYLTAANAQEAKYLNEINRRLAEEIDKTGK